MLRRALVATFGAGVGAAAASEVAKGDAQRSRGLPAELKLSSDIASRAWALPAALTQAECSDVVGSSVRAAAPSLSLAEPDLNQYELVQAQVIMRHGARSSCGLMPWETMESFHRDWTQCHLPGQAPEDPSLHPCAIGQLTQAGELMCRELGERLRKRYVDELGLVPAVFDPSQVQLRTTDVGRTKLSLRRVLEGMFPSAPPPQEVLDAAVERTWRISPNLRQCSSLLRHFHAAGAEANAYIEQDPGLVAAAKEFAQRTGHPFEHGWVGYGDWAHSRGFHGIPLTPSADGSAPVIPARLIPEVERGAWLRFGHIIAGDATSVRLGLGQFIDDLLRNIEAFVEDSGVPSPVGTRQGFGVGTAAIETASALALSAPSSLPASPAPKLTDARAPAALHVIAGHDTTLGPLCTALGVPLPTWPPFSSHLTIELWRERGAAAGLSAGGPVAGTPAASGAAAAAAAAPVASSAAGRQAVVAASEQSLVADETTTSTGTATSSAPVDGRLMPHISSRHYSARPAAFHDPHWVRVLFNGTVVSAAPLAQFLEAGRFLRQRSAAQWARECGPTDPTLSSSVW